MRVSRQTRILELISKYPIGRQEELLKRLKEDGYDVTQSTISRDINKLNLVKVMGTDGVYKYQAPINKNANSRLNFETLFSNSVLSVDLASNIVVIKTSAGTANAVCASLDSMSYDGVIGTLAGDDTIFAACKDEEFAKIYLAKFKELI